MIWTQNAKDQMDLLNAGRFKQSVQKTVVGEKNYDVTDAQETLS